jgi:hypothetical protein
LREAHAGVREQAVQQPPIITAGVRTGAGRARDGNDADPRVRFCTALVLAGIGEPVVVPPRVDCDAGRRDQWTRAAVLVASPGAWMNFWRRCSADEPGIRRRLPS